LNEQNNLPLPIGGEKLENFEKALRCIGSERLREEISGNSFGE
jgi:hypothetical protein